MPRAANSLNLNDLRWNCNQQMIPIEVGLPVLLNSIVWVQQAAVTAKGLIMLEE